MQETRVPSDPTCHAAASPVRHNYWACALEPRNRNYWAHVLQKLLKHTLESPCSTTREASTAGPLRTATREQPSLAAPREEPGQQRRPSTDKKKEIKLYFLKKVSHCRNSKLPSIIQCSKLCWFCKGFILCFKLWCPPQELLLVLKESVQSSHCFNPWYAHAVYRGTLKT